MTVTARKYNPGFLSDDELVASFCVRTAEFESIAEVLRECTGSANTHQIVIGPRGSGKTSLLLRVVAEIRRDAWLSSHFYPVVFAEESYEVSTAGEFWLESLSRLADQAPHEEDGPDLRRTVEDLRRIRDDRMLGDRCLGALLDFADREGKRLVLVVENLNLMFADMADRHAGWRLRHTLQTEPRIVHLASATSWFHEIDHPEHALYDLFRVLTLRPLTADECDVLWRKVSGQERVSRTVQALRILTGGSPRLLTIVARFGAGLSFRDLMSDLLNLVDDHTEYFKSHLEALAPQERRVYLALADLWKPATTREIADRARLDTSKCSAHLARLTDRGAVEVAGGSARRKMYYLSERLYNIYYLMRRARGSDPLIEALIRFMEAYYSPSDLRDFGVRIAREATDFDAETQSYYRTAIEWLIELPSLAAYRDELISQASTTLLRSTGDRPEAPEAQAAAKVRIGEAIALLEEGKLTEALAAATEIARKFGSRETQVDPERTAAVLLMVKLFSLDGLKRPIEALVICDEILQRFGDSDVPSLLEISAIALVKKGFILSELNRTNEALVVYDEVVQRFMDSNTPRLLHAVSTSLLNKGISFKNLRRYDEALTIYDEIVHIFGDSNVPDIIYDVAVALLHKGNTLGELRRFNEALMIYDKIVLLFWENNSQNFVRLIAMTLFNKVIMLVGLRRFNEALTTCGQFSRRFEEENSRDIIHIVHGVRFHKGIALGELERFSDALEVYDETLKHFSGSIAPELLQIVAGTLVNKGSVLHKLNRSNEALAVYKDTVKRFWRTDDAQDILHQAMEIALLRIAEIELSHGHAKAAIEAIDQVLEAERMESPESRWNEYLIRARAYLLIGDPAACEGDVATVLNLLPKLDSLPGEALDLLSEIAFDFDLSRMHELIQSSPAADLLLPLTTALELELGLKPRVAREVEEVAEDIRQDMRKRKTSRAHISPAGSASMR